MGNAATPAIFDGELIITNTLVLEAIEVIRGWVPCLLGCLQETLVNRIEIPAIRDIERTGAAMELITTALVGFRFFEIR